MDKKAKGALPSAGPQLHLKKTVNAWQQDVFLLFLFLFSFLFLCVYNCMRARDK